MKKITVIIVFIVSMALCQIALAGDDFTLHSGTRFGMSMDEVIKKEFENGFETIIDNSEYNNIQIRSIINRQVW